MAKKLAASDQSSSPEADDSLEVLNPDITVRVAGQDVTVREYRYFEGLRVAALAKPFLDALYAAFSRTDGAPDADDIASLIAEHEGIVMQMVAVSSGLTEQQLRALGQADGDVLTFAWWRANSAFFTQRVLRRALQQRVASMQTGETFSTASSPPDTSEHQKTLQP